MSSADPTSVLSPLSKINDEFIKEQIMKSSVHGACVMHYTLSFVVLTSDWVPNALIKPRIRCKKILKSKLQQYYQVYQVENFRDFHVLMLILFKTDEPLLMIQNL